MKIIYCIFFLMILTNANAHASSRSQNLLARDLSNSILSLPHETRLYHYFWISNDSQFIKNTYSHAQERQQLADYRAFSYGVQFWNMDNHNTQYSNAGPGLYLAIDPFISSPKAGNYSGAVFGDSMLEMTFRPGIKYLSTMKPILIKQDTINALIAENFLNSKDINELLKNQLFTRETLRYMVEDRYYDFRMLVQTVFYKNNIKLIEYNWQSALQFFCGNKTISSAMVYIGRQQNDPAILSNTLIYWPGFSRKTQLSSVEKMAISRNQLLIEVLEKVKKIEKKFQATTSSAKQLRLFNKASNYVKDSYEDKPEELEDVRSKLFGCNKG